MDNTSEEKSVKKTEEETDTPVTDDTPSNAINDDTKTQIAIESAIKTNFAKVDRVKEDLKPINEMVKSYLENDESYVKLTQIAKKASREKGTRKKNLLSTQNGKELLSKVTILKEELTDAQEALSHYLREYQRMTGLNEFEGEDGELRQIVYTAKLVRKTNLSKD